MRDVKRAGPAIGSDNGILDVAAVKEFGILEPVLLNEFKLSLNVRIDYEEVDGSLAAFRSWTATSQDSVAAHHVQ